MEGEDTAAKNHRMCGKLGKEHVYAPADGITFPVPRLRDDVAALLKLTAFDLPPRRVVRPLRVVHVYYGFGNALGKQFGTTISADYNGGSKLSGWIESGEGVRFRIGLWTAEEEKESSNYKELQNLVDTVKAEARAGRLQGCEFFLFTDNSTTSRTMSNPTE